MFSNKKKLGDFNIANWEQVLEELFFFKKEKCSSFLSSKDFLQIDIKSFAKTVQLSTPEVEKILDYAESQQLSENEIISLHQLREILQSTKLENKVFDLSGGVDNPVLLTSSLLRFEDFSPIDLKELILEEKFFKFFICEDGKRSLSATMFFKGRGGKCLRWVRDGWGSTPD